MIWLWNKHIAIASEYQSLIWDIKLHTLNNQTDMLHNFYF